MDGIKLKQKGKIFKMESCLSEVQGEIRLQVVERVLNSLSQLIL